MSNLDRPGVTDQTSLDPLEVDGVSVRVPLDGNDSTIIPPASSSLSDTKPSISPKSVNNSKDLPKIPTNSPANSPTSPTGKPFNVPEGATKKQIIATVMLKLGQSYFKVVLLFLAILSVFWGSIYGRPSRFTNLDMLVVSADLEFSSGNTLILPLLSDAFGNMLINDTIVANLGGYEFVSIEDFTALAESNNNTVQQEIARQIHHQKYWVAFYIMPNATELIYSSMVSGNSSLISTGAVSQLIEVVYESGRHFSALNQYVTKHIFNTQDIWLKEYVTQEVYNPLVGLLPNSSLTNLLSSNDTISILTTKPTFNILDMRPPSDAAVLGPSELGLIYALVFSFHQFNFSLEIYAYIRTRLKFRQYLVWRMFASQFNCVVLALVYCLATLAFQININLTFGHAGFMVYWAMMYLFISASGAINEVMATILLAYDLKAWLAPWMVINIVFNISTTFAPFELCPGFYKFGYALPMYNAYEALKVLFFNTWKGNLGRNIGILLAWTVVGQTLLLGIYQWQKKRFARKREREIEKNSRKET